MNFTSGREKGKAYEPIDCSRGESQEWNFLMNAQLVLRLIVLAIVPWILNSFINFRSVDSEKGMYDRTAGSKPPVSALEPILPHDQCHAYKLSDESQLTSS